MFIMKLDLYYVEVAESVDALVLETSEVKFVQVQVLFSTYIYMFQ